MRPARLRADALSMWQRLLEVPRLLFIGALFVLVALLRAYPRRPVMRLGRMPRTVIIGAVLCALASGTLAFAAGQQSSKPAAKPIAAPLKPTVLTVPDVRGQTYVFAKGMLEDAGFAWRVTGDVGGYAANSVASQTPAPGTRVFDTGFPTVELGLTQSSSYEQEGTPENGSSYAGTPIELFGEASAGSDDSRPPAFTVKGAPKESKSQASLPERADALATWLESHRRPTRANVAHWRYEHAWIVTGARFGWWQGAEALERLLGVDRRVQTLWSMGKQGRLTAKRALAEVREQSR